MEEPNRETELRQLAELYPAWTISKSGIGRWWAIREEARLRQGCRVTLDADVLEDLVAMLAEQERLRASSPGYLLTLGPEGQR